jgi:hypothetical protein
MKGGYKEGNGIIPEDNEFIFRVSDGSEPTNITECELTVTSLTIINRDIIAIQTSRIFIIVIVYGCKIPRLRCANKEYVSFK